MLLTLVSCLVMISLPFTASIGGSVAYWIIFTSLFIHGFFLGLGHTACYAQMARLPSAYMAVYLTSEALAGVFTNMLRFTSLELWPIDEKSSHGDQME